MIYLETDNVITDRKRNQLDYSLKNEKWKKYIIFIQILVVVKIGNNRLML